jgi:hypothetical protein
MSLFIVLGRSSREVDRFSGVIMPLWRLRCKIHAPDFLTRSQENSVPKTTGFQVLLSTAERREFLLNRAQLFDEGDPVNFVQC